MYYGPLIRFSTEVWIQLLSHNMHKHITYEMPNIDFFNPYSAEIYLYKPRRTKGFFI